MSEVCLVGACMVSVVSEGCLEGVWKVSGWSLEDAGGCLEGV